MRSLSETIKQLQFASEGASLDFKEAQYAFADANSNAKGELLKDILAFANAWRQEDAFILIGVREKSSPPHLLVGVSEHLDDARLQQFVNSKTNRVVDFNYMSCVVDGRSIGVVRIPAQSRPVFLRKNYGRLSKDTVYVRRGSATERASIEEIAQMGKAEALEQATPQVHSVVVQWSRDDGEPIGESAEFSRTRLSLPPVEEIPPVGSHSINVGGYSFPISGGWDVNQDFYRELADHVRLREARGALRLEVANGGRVGMEGALVLLEIPDLKKRWHFSTERSWPSPPQARVTLVPSRQYHLETPSADMFCEFRSGTWNVRARIGKVQPGLSVSTGSMLFVECAVDAIVRCSGSVFADNLPEPIEFDLSIVYKAQSRDLELDELREWAQKLELDD